METGKNQYIPPEVLALQDLGKQGKLWTIEVHYSYESSRRVLRKRNMTGEEVMKFRESMFRYGFTIPKGPGHWGIVVPMDLVSVDMYKQAAYFAE